jgi:hypothetical protein
MLGLMQDWPLTVDKILDHAKNWHGHREVVTRSVEGPHRPHHLCRDPRPRQARVERPEGLGVKPGDRIATLAWNTGRHIEAWYGIMGMGAVCHTLNPRLFPEQLAYIINHAEDKIIFVDLTFVPLLEAILPHCPSGRAGGGDDRRTDHAGDQAAGRRMLRGPAVDVSEDVVWGDFDEKTACGLCYTSGTTGQPQGRALLAPLQLHPHAAGHAVDRAGRSPVRGHPAGRADVPRQRLGHRLLRSGRGRQAGHAGREDGRRLHL